MSTSSQTTMRAVEAQGFGLDRLRLVDRPVPRPGSGRAARSAYP